jgi:ferredoxin
VSHWRPLGGVVFSRLDTGEEVLMRVEVDRDRCEGNAVCVGIAPDLFDLDDEDYAVVKADPVPADQEELAEQSIAECPRAALIRRD